MQKALAPLLGSTRLDFFFYTQIHTVCSIQTLQQQKKNHFQPVPLITAVVRIVVTMDGLSHTPLTETSLGQCDIERKASWWQEGVRPQHQSGPELLNVNSRQKVGRRTENPSESAGCLPGVHAAYTAACPPPGRVPSRSSHLTQ